MSAGLSFLADITNSGQTGEPNAFTKWQPSVNSPDGFVSYRN